MLFYFPDTYYQVFTSLDLRKFYFQIQNVCSSRARLVSLQRKPSRIARRIQLETFIRGGSNLGSNVHEAEKKRKFQNRGRYDKPVI